VDLVGKINDDAIYGRFPEFVPFLKRSDIQASLVRLAQMDTSTAQQIVQICAVGMDGQRRNSRQTG